MSWMISGFIYANNEPKSALVRDPGDCRDNKGKLVSVFSLVVVHEEKTLETSKNFSDIPIPPVYRHLQAPAESQPGNNGHVADIFSGVHFLRSCPGV